MALGSFSAGLSGLNANERVKKIIGEAPAESKPKKP